MHIFTNASTPPARWEKKCKTGYMPKHMSKHENEYRKTFLAPYFLMNWPRKLACTMELTKPNVPRIIPILNGSRPSPPNSTGVEYMRGIRTKWHISRKVKKMWQTSVMRMGRVKMTRRLVSPDLPGNSDRVVVSTCPRRVEASDNSAVERCKVFCVP